VVIGEREVGLARAKFSADFCLRLDHPSGPCLTKGEGGRNQRHFLLFENPFRRRGAAVGKFDALFDAGREPPQFKSLSTIDLLSQRKKNKTSVRR
jgi:hypothetical protein